MMTTRFFLDTRRPDKDGLFTLYLSLTKKGKTAMISLGLKLYSNQWDGGAVVNHPKKKFWNGFLAARKGDYERAIIELTYNGAFVNKSAKECLEILREQVDPEFAAMRQEAKERQRIEENSFARHFCSFLAEKGNDGTRGLYMDTYRKMESFCASEGYDFLSLSFDDITKPWLESFERYCLTTQRQNTASRHLRDIRAAFNAAIDAEKTTRYPFRKMKIKVVESRDKSFSASQLRSLFHHKCYPGGEQEAVDMFKLMFCLIGINAVDLAFLDKARNGRVEYVRRKTHKAYSVKLEPEAKRIIEKYRGEDHLLNILERVPNYKTYFNRMGKTLRKVGQIRIDGKKSLGKAILFDVCSGSARTSWATIAQEELDIDREVIAAALGHSTVDVTSTYLRTKWRKKVDEANRKVLDWVFYEKKNRD